MQFTTGTSAKAPGSLHNTPMLPKYTEQLRTYWREHRALNRYRCTCGLQFETSTITTETRS
jgi:hypothetical protein